MLIKVKVKPNSKKQEIVKISKEEYLIYLKKPAQDNKANEELIKLLKKELKKPARIVKGLTSRTKLIEV